MENIFKCPYVSPYPLKSSSCKLLKLDARAIIDASVISNPNVRDSICKYLKFALASASTTE